MNEQSGVKIIIIGARGIGNYGGFETFVERIGPNLVRSGHHVSASCEKNDIENPQYYEGVALLYFPLNPPKHYSLRKLFEVVYDNYFILKYSKDVDIVYLLGVLGAIASPFARFIGKRVIINVDGIESNRGKFSRLEKNLLDALFNIGQIFCNKVIIDNSELSSYCRKDCLEKVVFIPYGADLEPIGNDGSDDHNMASGAIKNIQNGFWLVIARLEPENNIETIVNCFSRDFIHENLIVVGDFTDEDYKNRVMKDVGVNIQFFGSVFNKSLLRELRLNCKGYLHGHSVGGTNPSLLEIMVFNKPIIAHDNVYNREVMGDLGFYFKDLKDLYEKIKTINDLKADEMIQKGMKERIEKYYTWDKITEKYIDVFSELSDIKINKGD